ncbi:hypothetical protein VB773_12475 [Haloarculaceae archaeon H-GB2-1]|nr:hypothetical protein [Haloarculaceae archaeon H-GB1-1]MEA5386815.1 hypothetical protein [Haloarculaceae archaeon H-GB11]MEA5408290.1 hypothetical protein [Haloarculaceae archaeon H-GB2-1]
MCNRHVAHAIADYEAARLDADGEETEGSESNDSEQAVKDQPGLLATLRGRFAR